MTAPTDQLDDVQVAVEARSGGVAFHTLYPSGLDTPIRVDYRLRVPRQVRLDELSTLEGDIVVHDVEGSMEARNLHGDIEGINVSGSVVAHALTGNILISLRALPDRRLPIPARHHQWQCGPGDAGAGEREPGAFHRGGEYHGRLSLSSQLRSRRFHSPRASGRGRRAGGIADGAGKHSRRPARRRFVNVVGARHGVPCKSAPSRRGIRDDEIREPRHISERIMQAAGKEIRKWKSGIKGVSRSKARGHTMSRKFFSGLALAIALLVAGGGVLHGQKVPRSPARAAGCTAPQPNRTGADPSHPSRQSRPSQQVFVLNDGAVHLGVTLGDVTTEKAQELKLPAVAGAIVNSVQKDSAAAKAGIEEGDAIMEFDGVRVRSSAELRRLIRETPAGRTVEIKIVRDGKTRVLSAKLEATSNHSTSTCRKFTFPPSTYCRIHIPPMDFHGIPSGAHRATLGISADDLTPQLAQYFGVKQGKGVLISEVTKGGAADKAGLKAGDVIVQVDGKPISGVEELRAALNDNFTGDTRKVSLTIVRDHHEQTVNAELTRSQTWEKRTSNAAGPIRPGAGANTGASGPGNARRQISCAPGRTANAPSFRPKY